ncbi:hypothetical protein KL928_005116 [Ogataea angusta]|uniref:Uncharacterized protein n=1 Tax=Pichia angusta TaxID=870730 RepID=A0AAN6DAZ9_PICAN|nr:uncharacterized protein KL928_005116 [Ogataea angusta]KAG7816150.1 hypothetical protein KL928_005116 [Ogataea angusta]
MNPVNEALLRSWLLPYSPRGRTTYTPRTSTRLIAAAAQMCKRSFFCSFAGSSAACSSSASMSSARLMLGCAVADEGGLGDVEGVLIDDGVAEAVRAGDPAQDAGYGAEGRADDERPFGHFAPEERDHDGEHARVDDDAAKGEQPPDGDPHVVEHDREHRHEQAEAHDGYVGGADELCSGRVWVDVGSVHVVGGDGRERDELGAAGAGDGHEQHDEACGGAGLAHDGVEAVDDGHAVVDLLRGELVWVRGGSWVRQERAAREAGRGADHGGDDGPAQRAERVALEHLCGAGRDSALGVARVAEHGAEAAQADCPREHEHGAVLEAEVALAGRGRERRLGLLQKLVHLARRPDQRRRAVDLVAGDEQDDVDDDGVDPVGDEGGLEAAQRGVHHDAEGQQEACGDDVHAGGGREALGPAEEQQGRDEHVGGEDVAQEHPVARGAEPDGEALGNGVCCRGPGLYLQAHKHKQGDLDGAADAVEKAAGDAVGVAPRAGREQRGGPRPRRHRRRGNEAGADVSGGCGEALRVLHLAEVFRQHAGDERHEQREGRADAQHEAVAVALVEDRGGHCAADWCCTV